MNIEIKKTVKSGNSSAVILPRAWLNQEVRVELIKKSHETILREAIDIAIDHIRLGEIIGVYLVGSYARGEEDRNSDIDVLIISSDTDKEMIHEGVYNILIVSERLLKWKLENDLLPIGSMLKEAKPLINSSYLNAIKVKVTKKNTKWYIDTTERKLQLFKKALEKSGKRINNNVVYSLVLRIRTLYIIQELIKNRLHSSKVLIRLIAETSGSNDAYESYLAIKNNAEVGYITKKEEAEKLYLYLRNQLGEIKTLLRNLKTD